MRKIIFCTIALCVAIFAFISCSDMNDMHDKYLRDGEKVYVGRVDSVHGLSGKERILIQYWLTDPRVKKLHVFWNQKRDSIVVPVPEHDPSDVLEVMIGNGIIKEGDHTFFFYSHDDRGHRSVVFETLLNVYGDRYQATLINRSIKSTQKSGDNQLTITWGGSTSNSEIGVSLVYLDPAGREQSILIGTKALSQPTVIDNIDITKPVRYQSFFLPQAEAIDTFRTEWAKVSIKERINVALRKNTISSDNLNDSYPSRNAVDGIIDNASRWVSDASNSVHWIEVDLGQPYAVDGFKTYIGSGGSFNYPVARFEFQAFVDGEWKTIISVTGNSDSQYGRDFESVTTNKVRYYVPAYTDNQVRLYELEVYSTIIY